MNILISQKSSVYNQNKNFGFNSKRINNHTLLFGHDVVSFKETIGPSKKTMQYLEAVKKLHTQSNTQLNTLNALDINKIMDICAGIPVFNGWNAIDLLFASNNIDSLLLSRGCYKQCSHCGTDSKPKIKFMKWENYTELMDGINILKERLGFNPFCIKKRNYIFPFHDSDPVDYRQIDNKGQIHTIFDAAKYFYDKTGSKFAITTAGWASENKVAQQAMENLVKHPEILQGMMISVHPFHRFMTKSIEFEQQGNLVKAQEYRNKYINMMANVIKTLAPLKQTSDLFIKLEYTNSSDALSFDSSKQLFEEIYKKIKSTDPEFCLIRTDETLEDLISKRIIFPSIIKNEGRSRNFPNKPTDFYTYDDKTSNQVTKDNLFDAKKYIDVDGSILASDKYTNLEARFVALPKKLIFTNPTEISDEYKYPALKEADLVYNISSLAHKLLLKINPAILV